MRRTNIALIGMMASGKTVTGKAISKATGMGFADTDEIVEQMAGRSVSDIFEALGEPAFRDLEEKAVRFASRMSWTVIATGGGAPNRPSNVRALRRSSVVFYLQASAQTLFRRANDGRRPLLDTPDPQKRLEELLEERDPAYRAACDKIISCEGTDPEQVAARITAAYRRIPY